MPNWKKLITSGSAANLSNLNVTNAVTASAYLGDGSALTGITVAQTATVSQTFSNQTSVTVDHNFNTRNVIIQTFDDNNAQVIPASVTLTSVTRATITFDSSTSGRVVVAKGGHIVSGVNVAQNATITDTFSNQTSVATSHNFDTKNVLVTVYDSNDAQIIPASVTTTNTNTVTTTYDSSTSGRVVVAKGGHLVSGSLSYSQLSGTPSGLISSSAQLPSNIISSSAQLPSNIISSSAQLPSNLVSSSAQLAASISGSLGANSTLIRSLTAANISGSFNSVSSSIATELNNATGSVSLNTRDSSTFAFWQGSQAQYDALGSYDSNVIYFTT
tara:strand:+ start:712 stop:1701 length:990 start_codon:yes stop_codon:yes gene_type:complete